MRRLALHASGLSDDEYELYTASLRDIADDSRSLGAGPGAPGTAEAEDDTYFENMHVGVREARAWLRERYSTVSPSVIDGILKLFSITLGHGDTLSGSEFFAALRLVVHAENGSLKEVDRSLAFVQAVPLPSGQTLNALFQPLTSGGQHGDSSIAITSIPHNPFAISGPLSPSPNSYSYFLQQQQPPRHYQPSESSKSARSTSASQPPRSDDGNRSSKPPVPKPIPAQATSPNPLAPPPRRGFLGNNNSDDESPPPPTKFCVVNTTHTSSVNTTILTSTNTSTTTTTNTITVSPVQNPKSAT
ncbi:hypothetical protein GALMADRAFT_138757 [Galerina marginata CBS 339.88]|uniref:Uncharacterized protein n=1 Tax=Galerina marginata (strain CBS 339.88) TaxID=685588 RepID=A0A067T3G9_GALM3|nr:hypothetical protein GALMADRAFT_138757 [Galerina marginata CBS 339.88]